MRKQRLLHCHLVHNSLDQDALRGCAHCRPILDGPNPGNSPSPHTAELDALALFVHTAVQSALQTPLWAVWTVGRRAAVRALCRWCEGL